MGYTREEECIECNEQERIPTCLLQGSLVESLCPLCSLCDPALLPFQ